MTAFLRRAAWVPLTLTLTASAVPGQSSPASDRKSLPDLVARALDVYPELVAARARVAAAEQAARTARADRGPRLFAQIDGRRHGKPIPVTPIHGFGLDLFPEFDRTLVQGSLQAAYTLFDSGVRRQKLRQAAARIDAETAALDADQQTVAARVAALFARVQSDRETLDAQAARVAALRAELDRVDRLLAVGKAAEVEKLRAEAELAGAEAEASAAAAALDVGERDLSRWTGLDPSRTRAPRLLPVPPPPEPTGDHEALQAAAVAASPSVAAARAALQLAEAGHGLARAAYFPKLQASGAYQELGGSSLRFASEWDVGLRLTIPLWDGGVTDGRVAEAAVEAQRARGQLAQSELEARQAADHAFAGWSDANARVHALERAKARLAEVARIQRLLLEVGSGTQIDYLDAESRFAAARANLATARSARIAARVELARSTGELDLDWLVQNLESAR